jgi:6-phosphogluconolactonase
MLSNIKIFDSGAAAANAVADYLIYQMDQVLANQNFFHLAVSGGSTPKLLFKILAVKYKTHYGWKRTRIFWVDERCVPADHPESNFGMTQNELLGLLSVKPQIFPIIGSNPPESEAQRYGDLLRQNVPLQNESPVFDLILLGMGEDGHTASLFPGQEQGFTEQSDCIVAEHPQTGQKRISLSAKILQQANETIFLVTGTEKAKAWHDIRDSAPSASSLPAFRVSNSAKKAVWYLDKAAAGE